MNIRMPQEVTIYLMLSLGDNLHVLPPTSSTSHDAVEIEDVYMCAKMTFA